MNKGLLILFVSFLATTGCGPTVTKCTTATCTGCCDQKTDTCVAGSEDAACGAGGTFCIACPAVDECKSDRTCGRKATNGDAGMVVRCNSSNCDGCCSDTGECFKGVSSEACGASGASCQVCATAQTCQKLNASSEFGGRCVL